VDPILYYNLARLRHGGSSNACLPCKLLKASFIGIIQRQKKLKDKTKNMSTDPRPKNTIVKHHQSSSKTTMVEVTEIQGKEVVNTMKKLNKMKDK
jgi:hypothetical protein